ncbi:MAG: SMC family ATPase [Rubrobacter sp.]|nr:SMC family ATPase [Rubrobacter sp.]
MNLERLYIENYKQLREPVELFPPEGAIGVVGANGTGKSTLFETILWSFFGSTRDPRFTKEMIPWSGGSTKDPTVVEVTLATNNGPYTVRRQLKSNATTAEVRDPEGRTVVTGATDVTGWVEGNLLGMDRTAFEATFYARQKELRFFAHDDGISRVRRVSRMLGISGVEAAQKLLREDRNDLRSEAKVIERRLEEANLDELNTGLEEAQAELKRLEKELEKVSKQYDEAEGERGKAREVRNELDAAYREYNRLTGELQRAEAEGRRSGDRAEEAGKDLEELARAEEELGRLKPDLERIPDLERELEKLDEDQRRAERREQNRSELFRAQKRIADIESEVWDTLEDLDGDEPEEPIPGWAALFELDGPDLLSEAGEVLQKASGELANAEAEHEKLREMASRHEELRLLDQEVNEAAERHEKAVAEERELKEELEDISGGEDLEKREQGLREEAEKLRELAANHRGRANANEREAKNVDKAREAIDSGVEDHCPTCHRGFESGEQVEISDTLRRQAASLRRVASRETENAEKFRKSADDTEQTLQKVSAKIERWREAREAVVRAVDRTAGRLEDLEKARNRHGELAAGLEGTTAPTQEDLEAIRKRCEHLRSFRDARPSIVSLAREHTDKAKRASELVEELEDLADISYDAEAHAGKKREKARLDEARGRSTELKRRIETRPGIEKSLEEARRTGEKAATNERAAREKLEDLGFDEAAYQAAAERFAAIEERVAKLRDAREHLGGEWQNAEHRVDRTNTELARLESDRKLANERASEAARMGEMDGLFTAFFRNLTARARPMLEAEASGLVRDLTAGRYERMEFDDNYGVRLLDRFEDSYVIDRFSGGEADVASLSARVALSKIIAASGGGTLGFLVLDEVFGSLDAGRRNNVLLALERLKRSFGQIFIISHVAEVQESALVDEVWMLEEDEEGKSDIRRVEQSAPQPADLILGHGN